jgi:hypothetical protein
MRNIGLTAIGQAYLILAGRICEGRNEKGPVSRALESLDVIARRLPATATTTAATAATAAVATTTAATATRTTTAAASAGLVLGFVDAQRTAAHRVTIQRLDSTRGISLRHLHEAESTRATRFPVSRKRNGLYRAVLREQRAHRSLIRRKREVANVNLRHEYRSPK